MLISTLSISLEIKAALSDCNMSLSVILVEPKRIVVEKTKLNIPSYGNIKLFVDL